MSQGRRWSGPEDAWFRPVARAIAVAFLAGDREPAAMASRAGAAIGDEVGGWLEPLAREMAEVLGGDDATPDSLTELILRCDHFTAVATDEHLWEGYGPFPWDDERVEQAPSDVPDHPARRGAVAPLAAPRDEEDDTVPSGRRTRRRSDPPPWPVPGLATTGELSEWFGLHPQHLRWYADVRRMERDAPAEALRHYTYRWMPKPAGGGRLLEAPKPLLRFFQRRILHEILGAVPVHTAAHGFRRGRSIETFAAPHAGQDTVIRLDLEAFFASVPASRVAGIFRTAGYPQPVAQLLTGLTTNTVPPVVRRAAPAPSSGTLAAHRRLVSHLAHPHLPQGAPSSPALANVAAFRLDCRLAGLADAFGATYTRYADDLALSGGHRLARHADRVVERVSAIAADEGFRVHAGKTRVRRAGERQVVAGLVVNDHPQAPRAEYDRLRAVLHDAATNGPSAANRAGHPDFRAHLLGRIGWVGTGNPARAARLRAGFAAIDWDGPAPGSPRP